MDNSHALCSSQEAVGDGKVFMDLAHGVSNAVEERSTVEFAPRTRRHLPLVEEPLQGLFSREY